MWLLNPKGQATWKVLTVGIIGVLLLVIIGTNTWMKNQLEEESGIPAAPSRAKSIEPLTKTIVRTPTENAVQDNAPSATGQTPPSEKADSKPRHDPHPVYEEPLTDAYLVN